MKLNSINAARIIVGLFICAIALYGGQLAVGKLELGGSSPDKQVLGSTTDLSQRAMEQYCTGVLVTPKSTWLVGRREGSLQSAGFEFARNVPDLSELVYGKKKTDAADDSSGVFSSAVSRRDESISFISRLTTRGTFELIAIVPEVACLRATPDGKTVFLMTGLDRPKSDTRAPTSNQDVILQSDDQGVSWKWRQAGMFPDSESIGWNLAPYFFDARSVWAWRNEMNTPESDPATQLRFTGLQYSADGGASVQDVMGSEALLINVEDAKKKVNGEMSWGAHPNYSGDVKRHVLQFDTQKAALWVSQTFQYRKPENDSFSNSVTVTSFAPLSLVAGRWQAGKIQRVFGFAIESLRLSGDGKIFAVVRTSDGDDERLKLAQLERDKMAWQDKGKLPSAFAFLPSWTGLRDFNVGRNAIVVNTTSNHEVPRAIYPWGGRGASISGESVFYSVDGGQSWTRLSVDGYLGLLGLDTAKDRVIWAKGNWYSSRDANVYSYGLR